MPHLNAPLTATGRLYMVSCHLDDGIPKAHVTAKFRVSRPTMSTWVTRYLAEGEQGLTDRPSTPTTSPTQIPPQVVSSPDLAPPGLRPHAPQPVSTTSRPLTTSSINNRVSH